MKKLIKLNKTDKDYKLLCFEIVQRLRFREKELNRNFNHIDFSDYVLHYLWELKKERINVENPAQLCRDCKELYKENYFG